MTQNTQFEVGGEELSSRMIIGTALYPSPDVMKQSIVASAADVITVSLRRQNPADDGGMDFWQYTKQLGKKFLPNTAGCHSVKEAITTAQMAREIFDTNWIKLEVIGDDYNLQPDPFALLEAATELIRQDFVVFPYCTDDLVLCQKLHAAGCDILMPWGAPIGTGKGLINPYALKTLRSRLPEVFLVIDAGIGLPSHAAAAMELGFDAVMLNTAIAQASDPVLMAGAFGKAIEAGREAYLAGNIQPREAAQPSSPVVGMPFWHQEENF
ncbi:MAG: thiazole synthase [Pseudomonadales bacterium]|nr:thiazole synthase [Pseudomonadales bacterium]